MAGGSATDWMDRMTAAGDISLRAGTFGTWRTDADASPAGDCAVPHLWVAGDLWILPDSSERENRQRRPDDPVLNGYPSAWLAE
jgi:hypothetical protein